MNEELKTYWQYLRDNNADVPDTFESFHSTLQDDVSAKKYYDYLKTEGFDAPDSFESFASTLGLKKKGSTALSTEPTPNWSKDYLASLQYQPSPLEPVQETQPLAEPVVTGTIPITPDDNSEERANEFLAAEQRKDLEQLRIDTDSGNIGIKNPFVKELMNAPAPITVNPEKSAKEAITRFQEDITGKPEHQGVVNEVLSDLAQVPPSFNKGVISVASTIPKGVAILAKKLDDMTGDRSEDIEKYSTYQLGQWIEDKAKEIGIGVVDDKRAGFINSTVPMAFGQMIGMMLTGGPAAAEAGLVPESIARQTVNTLTSPMAMSGALQAAVPEYEAAKAAGQSDSEAFSVFFKNIPGGMTEVIPIANMFSRLNKVTGNGLLNALKLGTAQGFEEGSQEAVQQYLTNKIAQGTYDPKRDLREGLLEGAGAGFIVGFLMPGIMGAMENMTPEDKLDTKNIIEEYLKSQPEQTVKAPSGDLGVKPATNEKPKGQVGKVDSKPLPEDIQKESVQVQAEVKKAEEKVDEPTKKQYTIDVAKLQDDGSVKRIREEVEGKPYKKYPSLGLFSHNDPNRTFGGMTVGGYAITEEESGFQVVSGKTIKEAKDKLDELVDQYGGEDAFKKVMEEQIAKRRKNQKAEEKVTTGEASVIEEYLKSQPEQTVKAPSGDLGVKPATNEKPKEQVEPVKPAKVPKVEAKESVPVQGEQEKQGYKAGETVELAPKIEGKSDVDEFVDKVKSGDQMNSPEDIQFYENNKKEIEVKLKSDIAKQKIENPEIDETEIATREDAADEDTVIKQGEDVIRKATAVANEEEAELSLDEIERTLTATEKKIKGLRDKYDTSDIPHEYPNKVVGKEAKKDIRKYVGVVSKYTGWEPTKLYDNIAPAGGDVSFTLSIPNTPYEMYAQVKYDPDYNNGYENYKPVEIFYRIENPNEKGQKKYAGPNQLIILDDSNRGWPGSRKFSGAAKFSPKDLAQIFIEEAKKFTGKKEANEIATQEGFDSPSHLINSVKKRTGQEFENVQDIPKKVIEETVKSKEDENLYYLQTLDEVKSKNKGKEPYFYGAAIQMAVKDGIYDKLIAEGRITAEKAAEVISSNGIDVPDSIKGLIEKPKITQIKEANPERILVVKPTSDIKGVTEIKYEDDGDTILYGAKNNKTRVSVKGLTKERIQEELDFERESLARIKKQVSEFDEQKILSSKGLSDQEKQDAIKLNKQTKNNIDAVEKIVIPFYESKIEPKAPRKSDAKFEKARKSAAELLDLIGPGLKIDEKYDSEKGQKIIIKAGEVVSNYIDAGVTRFAEMLQDIYETYGEKGLRMMFEPMKKGYGSQMASVSDEVAEKMDDLKTVRGTKIEDILKTISDEQTGTTTTEPSGGTSSRTDLNNEPQPEEGTESGQPAGGKETTGTSGTELRGSEGSLPEIGDDTTGSTQGGDTGRIRPELADADVQHNFTYPENWERTKNKTFSKRQAYKDNIAALEVVSNLLDNPELFATDQQKQILSRYNGLGPLGEILLSDNKGGDWTKSNLEFYEDSQRLKELLKEIGEKTGTNPLKTAKESSLNAYYTSLPVIRSIWDGLTAGKFTGGRILEGSMGSGRFIGGMPPHVMASSRIKGVDLDVVSSLISRYLYPKVSVSNTGLQQASTPSNYYDLFISNIPFGTNKIYDPQIDKKGPLWKQSQEKIHTYFFAKAIDSVRPGGYVAILTSANVLDSQSNQGIRDLMNQETDFVGAVRLSSDAFNADAGTQVVTDIVLLRKKVDKSAPSTNEDINTISTKRVPHKDRNRPEQAIKYNDYFQRNPDHVFGDEWEAGGLYSAESGYTLKGEIDIEALSKKLQELASQTPIVEQKENTEDVQKVLQISPLGRMVSGGIVEQKGEYFKVQDYDQQTGKYTIEQIKKTVMPSAKDLPILESFVETKNIYFDVLAKDKQGLDTKNERAELKKSIDEFVKAIKPSTPSSIGSGNKAISRMLVSDPDFYAITSLVKDDGTYSDIVDKPIKTDLVDFKETNNPQEAIGYSINTYGRINLPFIQKVMGAKTEQEAIDKIQDEIFETPDGEVIEKTEYLSGNVVEKLKQAQQWTKSDKKYEKNATELEKVIPEPIPLDRIKFQLGMNYIPMKYTQQFFESVFGPGMVTVRYNKATDDYDVETRVIGGEYEAQDDEGNRRGVEVVIKAALTKNVPIFTKIVDEQTIPLPKLTQDVRDKSERLQDEFEGLIQADPQMGEELAAIHNEVLNGIVIKVNDGSKLTFPGWSHPIYNLADHQKDAIMLMIQRMGGMIDHIVGGGKSFIMGAGGIKMKQLGLVNKPMITTMKSVIPGMVEDIKAAYPAARILSPKDTDFSASNRQRLFAQIANNEWDLIIISHENLGTIPLPSDFETEYINNELDELTAAIQEMNADKSDKWAVKQAKALEKRKLDLQAKLQELQDKGKYGSRTDFGTMGIDFLMVDESQQFKNLNFITKLRGTAGLGNPQGSKRASNLKMVSRYLQKMHGGDKGLVFASGTPISNSLVELYNIFQYLRPSILKKLQMNSLDQFIKNFAMITSLMEKNVAGVIKNKTRLTKFVNVTELASLYSEVSDIRGVHNLKLPRPEIKGGKAEIELIPQSETQKMITTAIYNASKMGDVGPLQGIGINPKGDAKKALGLVLTTLGTKASIDPRMVFPNMKEDGGKIPVVAKNVKRIFDETKKDKGVQLVFADMGTPKNKNAPIGQRVRDQIVEMHGEDMIEEVSGLEGVFKLKDESEIRSKLMELLEIDIDEASDIIQNANDVNSFNVYGEFKNRLIKMGIPADQIAFIHDAPTKAAKEKLFAKVNSGEIRVLVGSTMKMGTGVNVQRRVAAMHHIDVGWRPSDLEQRNGRGIRRGNMNKEVEIYYYGTMETIDAYRFGLLAKKQSGIDSFRAGANGVREMEFEDGESMTMSEFEAAISGDTRILDLEKLKAKAYKLKNRVDSVKRANALRERRIRDSKEHLDRQRAQRDITKEVGEQLKKGTKIEELEDEVEVDGKVKKQKVNVAIFKGEVNGKEYDTSDPKQRKEFYDALADNIRIAKNGTERGKVGVIGGVNVYAEASKYDKGIGAATVTFGDNTWGFAKHAPEIIKSVNILNPMRVRIGVTATIRDYERDIENTQGHYEQALVASKKADQILVVEAKQKDIDDLAETEAKRKALSDELKAEAKKNEPGYQPPPEEETSAKPLSDMIKDISDLGSEQYKDIDGMAMTSFIPGLKPKGKVRVKPNNNKLIAHVVSKNAQATPEQQLQEAIQFNDPEVQKRFDESRVWTSHNMESLFNSFKDFVKGFSQHYKYLNANKYPREANILREFETLNKWAKGEATRYMKGLVSPLTPEQYTIFSNRIILADLLDSIKRGENMAGVDGKFPFGLSSVQEIKAEFDKFDELMKAEPAIEKAFNAREGFMEGFRQELISSGLLEENEIDDYYHRRVLEYQHDSLNENILFGKTIGDKKRSFQKRRTGTRGMDYNTNFIETEFKVVSEGLFELEKQKILKDLMAPYEVELKALEGNFKKEFNKKMKELEDQYGPDSEEVKIHNDSKRVLKINYLFENIPDDYVFWRVSEENRLFWGKTVTQKVIDNALNAAAENDQSGMSDAMKIVDDLVGSMQMGLMVGSKRKQYMIPKQLAQQLEEMAKEKEIGLLAKLVTPVTTIWKRHTLAFPTRILRYNLNNLGGDLDRTLQVEPAILKYSKESYKELYDYYTTGKVTDQLIEAMRGDVISSGFQISELADLKKQDWVKWVDSKSDLTVEKVMGKEWVKANAIAIANKPADLYNKYMDAATKIIEFREAILRYAAYKLAVEKINKGQTFDWASDPKKIDKITDKRQKAAKLSREVYGDYVNLSLTGTELRRNAMPFYSWAEINMRTHWQLIKNASSPEAQRRMIATGLAKGIPRIAVKMAWAYTKLALFSAAIQAWNYSMFGADDDDDDSAMAKLRRSTIKGLQVIVDVDPETGFIKTLPIQGTFYDFLDFMGIPNAWSDVSDLVEQDKPVEAGQLFEIPKNMVGQTINRTSQMVTPFAKMMFELPAKVKYFPDVWNPIPFRDRWEYVAETVALKDEYNYIFSDAPKKENYWKRKWNNSLFLREFDTELLAYYATKKIISEYKGGATGYQTGQNKVDQDKSKAAYYYSLSKRYGNTEAADKYLNQYIELEIKAIGQEFTSTGSGTAAALSKLLLGTGNNPAKDLSVIETNDLVKLFADPNYKPMTAFGKSLTPREIAIMKDGTRFYNRISGFNGPSALFIKK